MSWVDEYVKSLFALRDSEFYVVASGLTTSGPAHMGTVMEVLIPYTISKTIRSYGRKSYFIFIADTMDSLDSIPMQLTSFTELKDFIGRPLYKVLDPYGCHSSYGYHFLDEVLELMKRFSIECDEVLTADNLYLEGWYDDYARLFFSRLDEVRDILEVTSFRKLPPNWMGVVKPICSRCGRNDSTVVTSFNEAITYECTSCGFRGSMYLEEHNWKLLWRLDWPSRQDFLGVDVEGGGVDHFTRGGSWDTAVEIHRRLFGRDPPIGFKFGFVLVDGKKMSKSKGLGSLSDIMRFVHPTVIKYFLLKHDLEENRNLRIDPKYFLSLYEEYKLVGDGRYQDVKQLRAWELSSNGIKWRTSFSDLLIYYQIYRDWGIISDLTRDYESIDELKSYVEEWVRNNLLPEEYDIQLKPSSPSTHMRDLILEFCRSINESMSDVDIHNKVYELARSRGVDPSELFKAIYLLLFSKPRGPRLGKFIKVLGVERFKVIVNKVLNTSS